MNKVKGIFLSCFIFISIILGVGADNKSLNTSLAALEQQYSSWTIENVYAGQNFYLLWAKDDQGDDHLYTWGENSSGQLANDTIVRNYTPTEIDYGNEWGDLDEGWEIQQISVGFKTVMVVVEDNEGRDRIYAWGENTYYDLGLNNQTNQKTPKEVNYSNFSSKNEEVTDISSSERLAIVSTVDSSGKNHFYTTGLVKYGALGRGDEYNTNPIFTEIAYSDAGIKSSSNYTVKGVFADGYSNTYSGSYPSPIDNEMASYIWTEDDDGVDHIYGAGGNHYRVLLGASSSPDNSSHVSTFSEVSLPRGIDQDGGNIKQFYSSPVTVDDEIIGDGSSDVYNTYYSEIVYTDSSNRDHLYSWGYNAQATLANNHKENYNFVGSPFIRENTLTDGTTELPNNYTIDYVEANSYNNYAVITDQDTKKQSVYFWGASRGKGLSTYAKNTDAEHYRADYYDTPVEINYPDNLDLTTNRITNISGGFNNTFLLTEDDNQIQHLYIWGDNRKNLVSENTDKIIYQPTLIFNSVNIIDFKVDIINKNNINYTFTVENGNELKSIIMNDDQGNQNSFSEEDWKVINSDQYSTTYSLRVDGLLDGTYNFDQVFYNSYFDLTISNSGEKILIEFSSFYIWIIILVALLLVLLILFLLLIYLKKRKNKLKLEMEREIYIS